MADSDGPNSTPSDGLSLKSGLLNSYAATHHPENDDIAPLEMNFPVGQIDTSKGPFDLGYQSRAERPLDRLPPPPPNTDEQTPNDGLGTDWGNVNDAHSTASPGLPPPPPPDDDDDLPQAPVIEDDIPPAPIIEDEDELPPAPTLDDTPASNAPPTPPDEDENDLPPAPTVDDASSDDAPPTPPDEDEDELPPAPTVDDTPSDDAQPTTPDEDESTLPPAPTVDNEPENLPQSQDSIAPEPATAATTENEGEALTPGEETGDERPESQEQGKAEGPEDTGEPQAEQSQDIDLGQDDDESSVPTKTELPSMDFSLPTFDTSDFGSLGEKTEEHAIGDLAFPEFEDETEDESEADDADETIAQPPAGPPTLPPSLPKAQKPSPAQNAAPSLAALPVFGMPEIESTAVKSELTLLGTEAMVSEQSNTSFLGWMATLAVVIIGAIGTAFFFADDLAKMLVGDAEKIEQTDQDKAQELLLAGQELFKKKKYGLTLQKFRAAYKLQPDFPDVHRLLGVVYAAKKDNALAVKHYREYIKLADDGKEKTKAKKIVDDYDKAEAKKRAEIAAPPPPEKKPAPSKKRKRRRR